MRHYRKVGGSRQSCLVGAGYVMDQDQVSVDDGGGAAMREHTCRALLLTPIGGHAETREAWANLYEAHRGDQDHATATYKRGISDRDIPRHKSR